jgi:branched-chain amino acid transport system ATP-binding protein
MGQPIDAVDPEKRVSMGIFQVMEGRRVFDDLNVDENLYAGAHTRKSRADVKKDMEMVFEYFPRLTERRPTLAGYLSGGEQQMLAIGRALMARPKLMLLDEPSLGLAPLLVKEIFGIIDRINKEEGTTILLVEQNARIALSIADYGYIMENGKIVMDDPVDKLKENEDVKEFYLGLSKVGDKRSYRDVKHYRRRKRWIS